MEPAASAVSASLPWEKVFERSGVTPGAAPPGVTPDRSKTLSAGGEPGSADAAGSTAGLPPQLGHLHSVVGLVWRSVVLWMLLLALLTLANIVG